MTRERLLLATCGGWTPDPWHDVALSPLQRFALELTGVTGRRVRAVILNTAGGDDRYVESRELAAAARAGVDARHLRVFGRNHPDVHEALADADLVWVGGGSVVNLLALWRAHGIDEAVRDAWHRGVVLAGTSAGALCWHLGGPTSSFGPDLSIVTDCLGLLPQSLAVHYDSQPARRPLFRSAVATGRLPAGYGIDEGVGVLYRGTDVSEVVAETDGLAYRVERRGEAAEETTVIPRRLTF